ncbi:DNA methyltransferase [Bosea sp. Root483D1]|uniref:class I SAM-dependent DNA methyltransferase n=1 Tax=Bosea sp. Root483D1 TaxID=1736544 RepID=UPI0007108B9B|nr:class I SAM-dependent DNA methyltransferase [Bosea sp. Root483D1]KRE14237.1 DNA methyltransferase [Bosea sp. Root483D1]
MATDGNGGGDFNFEAELFKAADKLRGNLEPSEYKHVALGLIFLKYISEAFEAQRQKLLQEDFADPEDPEEYLAARVFWVPEIARWSNLRANARARDLEIIDPNSGNTKKVDIGGLIDTAMESIEKANETTLKGVLPKDYGRPSLDRQMIGDLVELFSNFKVHEEGVNSRDLLGRTYEYFLSGFAGAEGRRGGEFFTPRSVVRVLVDMLEPYKGRVYDPCCGSGGMFVQSEEFIKEHGGRTDDISIYGQERNNTTWKLCKMNLAVRGIDADIRWNNEGSFVRNEFSNMKFDFILANPPFNVSDWWRASLEEDIRWTHFGTPPQGNANYAWLSHIYHHLAPRGTAGVVLANGSMSSQQSGEGEMRRAMIEKDAVDCMIALPGQLFYSTQIPACLWFLARDKSANGHRDRRGEILFIDARKLGRMVDRTRREFSEEDVAKITDTYHRWRSKTEFNAYRDEPGFCASVTREKIAKESFVLTPGRYVAAEDIEDDGLNFADHLQHLTEKLGRQFAKGQQIEALIRQRLAGVGQQ